MIMSLRYRSDFILFSVRKSASKNPFFRHLYSTILWNGLDTSVCTSISHFFKQVSLVCFNCPTNTILLNFSFDRYTCFSPTLTHTRIRLDTCALNYYLFKIGCKSSLTCACGFETESINHHILHCLTYAALRLRLFTSARAARWTDYCCYKTNLNYFNNQIFKNIF